MVEEDLSPTSVHRINLGTESATRNYEHAVMQCYGGSRLETQKTTSNQIGYGRMAKFPAPSPEYIGPPNNHGPKTNKPIQLITLHETQSPCEAGGARDIAKFFVNTDKDASAHYIIDPKEIIQGLYDSYVGYAAPPNEHKLHLEICGYSVAERKAAKEKFERPNVKEAYARAAWLTAQLCLAYGIPPRFVGRFRMRMFPRMRGVTTHSVVSDVYKQSVHWDPGVWPRRTFMREVRKQVNNAKRKK